MFRRHLRGSLTSVSTALSRISGSGASEAARAGLAPTAYGDYTYGSVASIVKATRSPHRRRTGEGLRFPVWGLRPSSSDLRC